jgi:hypothetical protein
MFIKTSYRSIDALPGAFLPEEAHGYCGDAFGDFYEPPKPFVLSLSKHCHFE